ncbi:ogr/Delta-like zinc finger family protein [Escherichia coli]|uniref:ogr/Delta-like zinc finger family protein n=1 Tax=Escherichia coli TaxID=562 RepID=UPI003EDF2033
MPVLRRSVRLYSSATPFCSSDSVKESYLQCQNVHCSATFKTHESIFEVIRSPVVDEKPAPVPTVPVTPRRVKSCYSSPFHH